VLASRCLPFSTPPTKSKRIGDYSRITKKIIADLEQGMRPWHRPGARKRAIVTATKRKQAKLLRAEERATEPDDES
jgi:antirestriction protein ArdC